MSDDEQGTEPILRLTGLQGLTPEAQAIAVREMTAAVVSRNRWSRIENVVAALCITACFCTTCVTCWPS